MVKTKPVRIALASMVLIALAGLPAFAEGMSWDSGGMTPIHTTMRHRHEVVQPAREASHRDRDAVIHQRPRPFMDTGSFSW